MTSEYRISVKQADAAADEVAVTLTGKLDFDSVPAILPELQTMVKQQRVSLDLSGVSAANSAALALLLELRRTARQQGHKLILSALPDGILKIARVCEVEDLLANSN